MTVLILAFLMAKRHLKARQLFFYFLPVLALSEVFSFYRGWLSVEDGLELHPGLIFLIAFVIYGGITTAILLIYNSKFMKDFFSFTTTEPREEKTNGHADT